ncbi:MAG TPA: hypothetical protein VF531_13755 [Bacillota bacterium]
MKFRMAMVTAVVLTFLVSVTAYASIGGDNYVWVSEDLKGEYSKIGYFRQDQMFTKIISTNSKDNVNSFDLSIGNRMISFDNSSGLYGELGVNSGSSKLNLFFGAGYTYQSSDSDVTVMIGPKYYIQDQKLVTEAQAFVRILPPLVLSLGYDDNSKAIFVGAGLRFE